MSFIEKDRKSLAKCPEELKQYIDLVNKIPYSLELLNGQNIYKKYFQSYVTYIKDFDSDQSNFHNLTPKPALKNKEESLLEITNKTINECMKGVPEEFCNFIKQKAWLEARHYQDNEDYELILARRVLSEYIDFYQVREDLKNFVEYFQNWRRNGLITFGVRGEYSANGKLIGLPLAQAVFVKEDSKYGTRVTVEPHGLSAALDGIIGERVRSCEICNKIFWAQRKESETCSSQCANKLRVRKHRQRSENGN